MTTMTATPKTAPDVAALGRRFVVNTSFGLLSKAAHFGVSLFLVSYVLARLGAERFGLVVIASTLVAFLGLLQAGAAAGLGRHLNLFHSRGDTASFNQYYSAGAVLSLGVALIIATGLGLLLTVLWPWTQIPAPFHSEGQWVLAALGAATICSCLTLPAIACLQAVQRIDVSEKSSLAGILLRGIGVVLLFESFGATAQGYAAVLLLEQVFVSVAIVLALARVLPGAKFSLRQLTPGLLRAVAGFNLLNLVANLNYVAFMQAPAFILQRFEGLALAGFYGIGLQLNNLVRGLLQPVVNALAPAATTLHAGDRTDQFRRLFLLSTKGFTAAAAVLWVFLYFLREPLLQLWLRRDVAPLTEALPWFIAASAAGVAAMPASVFALALGRMKLPAISGLVLALVMTAAISALSARGWEPGLVRVGICLAVCFGLYQIIRVLEVCAALKVHPGDISLLVLRALVPAACASIVLLVAGLWGAASSLIVLACVTTIAGAAALVGANWTLLSSDERETLTRVLSSARQPRVEAQ
jgi:O-antigen/teichoic acid export membrane protein